MKLLEEIAIRESGEVVLTEKIIVGNSFAIERRAIQPGEDYSTEEQRVQAVCGLVHSESYLGIAVPALTPPDWDSFNAYMLSDPMFKGYRDTVRSVDGDLNGALFDAYGLVATNGVSAFSLVWGLWVSVSWITVADKEIIATTAEGFNLPSDFVAVIRG